MWELGMIPARLTCPTAGLYPTMPHMPDGDTIDPFVSVPTARGAYPAATATPEPELDPDGFRSSWYGFTVCPPRPLHPLIEYCDRIFAHSVRFVLPRITAPASRRRFATNESRLGVAPTSASEPAVVSIRSAVATLSFRTTVTPCNGPRTVSSRRSASSPF